MDTYVYDQSCVLTKCNPESFVIEASIDLPSATQYSNYLMWDGTNYIPMGQDNVKIGSNAGFINQGLNTIAIGRNAGYFNQGIGSVAIGPSGAYTGQGINCVAVGSGAGRTNQRQDAVAVGRQAGYGTQGTGSVAIGVQSGFTAQGDFSIAIGNQAGYESQHNQTIILNSSGFALNSGTANSFYVKPIRQAIGPFALYYATSSGEITYDVVTQMNNKPLFGRNTIKNGFCEIQTQQLDNYSIQITPIDKSNSIFTSQIVDGKFTVYGQDGEFFWNIIY